jgi:hypothetical protein
MTDLSYLSPTLQENANGDHVLVDWAKGLQVSDDRLVDFELFRRTSFKALADGTTRHTFVGLARTLEFAPTGRAFPSGVLTRRHQRLLSTARTRRFA